MINTKLNIDAIPNASIKLDHLLESLKEFLNVDRVILVSGAVTSEPVKLNEGDVVNVIIPEVKEAYLTMGGLNIKGGITPLDRCFGDEFRNNRLAYLPPEYISIEYSLDAGETWVSSTYGDESKRLLVTDGFVCSCYAGGSDLNQTKQSRVRVTIDIPRGALYCTIDKLLLYISTGSFNEGDLLVEYTTYDNSTFNTMGLYAVKGYSEWNSIPWTLKLNFLGEYSNGTRNTHINKIRLTLIPNQNKEDEFVGVNVSISKIRLFGTTVFNNALLNSLQGLNYVYGRIYGLDINKNVTFPEKVTAKSFAVSSGETLLTSANFENTMSSIIELAVEKGKLLALRKLFIAAGASYNDTGADVTKTAPWGETVTHKAGHYYLNGLGDITEEQMVAIYTMGKWAVSETALGFGATSKARTNLPVKYVEYYYKTFNLSLAFNNESLEVIVLYDTRFTEDRFSITCSLCSFFTLSATKLYRIEGILNVSKITSYFKINGSALKYIKIKDLKTDLYLLSPVIEKESILYVIKNAIPTKAITIILHRDAYDKFIKDEEVLIALKEQNGYEDSEGNWISGSLPEGVSINLAVLK